MKLACRTFGKRQYLLPLFVSLNTKVDIPIFDIEEESKHDAEEKSISCRSKYLFSIQMKLRLTVFAYAYIRKNYFDNIKLYGAYKIFLN